MQDFFLIMGLLQVMNQVSKTWVSGGKNAAKFWKNIKYDNYIPRINKKIAYTPIFLADCSYEVPNFWVALPPLITTPKFMKTVLHGNCIFSKKEGSTKLKLLLWKISSFVKWIFSLFFHFLISNKRQKYDILEE